MATNRQLEYLYRLLDQLGIRSVTTALQERGLRHASMLEELDIDEASQLIDQLKEERSARAGR